MFRVIAETQLNESDAQELMLAADGDLRVAILIHRTGANVDDAKRVLAVNDFVIERAVAQLDR